MKDILDRIDMFFEDLTPSGYIPKEEALSIISVIEKEIPEDTIHLETFYNVVDKYWSYSNTELLEDFNKMLGYYGIIDSKVSRKSVVEQKGRNIVRKFISLKNNDKIKALLK